MASTVKNNQAPDQNKLHRTETHNPASLNCHTASALENLRMLNEQNAKVHLAVAAALPAINVLVTETIGRLKNGGRLFYIGAGTSGRLGVLDASEMPPTFGTDSGLVQGIIAGGNNALRNPDEIAEDSPKMGIDDTAHITDKDVLVGISASGSAVYVRAALQEARTRGVYTAAICTASDAPLLNDVECPILGDLISAGINGEIPAGSTRMFSGTVQKMILNMITTTTMIGLGKVYAGYMIDVMTNNQKLVQRAEKMLMRLTDCPEDRAQQLIDEVRQETKNPVKPAVVMFLENVSYDEAKHMLGKMDDRIDPVMEKHKRNIALGCK